MKNDKFLIAIKKRLANIEKIISENSKKFTGISGKIDNSFSNFVDATLDNWEDEISKLEGLLIKMFALEVK